MNKIQSIRLRKVLAFLLLIIISSAACAGAYYFGTLNRPVALKAPSASTSPIPEATDDITEPISVDIIGGGGFVTSTKYFAFNAQIPKSWRSQLPRYGGCGGAGIYQGVNNCLTINLANAVGSPTTIDPDNEISVYDLSQWVSSDDVGKNLKDNSIPLAVTRTETAYEKTADFNKLLNLANDRNISSELAKKQLINFFGTKTFTGNPIAGYFETADGGLKGYSLIGSLCDVQCYAPSAIFVAGAYINGIPMMVTGNFKLNDTQSDTNRLFDLVTSVMKNITLQPKK